MRTLLVHGAPGAGKRAFVDDLLALAFCADPDVDRRPCNACRGCGAARSRAHPDLVVGSPEAWRENRAPGESIVAAARRWLLETAGAPIASERRVIVIEGADRANEQIQNALLKALEEPTARHMFVLVADEPGRLLPTIRSRAQALRIGRVPHAELVGWLVDRQRVPADQAEAIARIAAGLAGTAAAYVERADVLEWRRRVQHELVDLLGRGRAERFAAARELLDDAARLAVPPPRLDELDTGAGAPGLGRPGGPPPADASVASSEATLNGAVPAEAPRLATATQRSAALLIVDAWTDLARDLLVSALGRPEQAGTAEIVPELPSVGGRIGPDALVPFLEQLERTREALEQNASPRLALEAAMLAWRFL